METTLYSIEGSPKIFPVLTEAEKGYIAGIIDGEGYIGILDHRHSGSERYYKETKLVVSMMNEEVIRWLQSRIGGSLFIQRPRPPKINCTSYRLTLTRKMAAKALLAVRPYLIVKRTKAEMLFAIEARRGEGLPGYEGPAPTFSRGGVV